MKKFLKYFKSYTKETILGPLFKLIETITELIIPMLVAVMIDKGVASKDLNLILVYGAIIVALNIVGIVTAIISNKMAAKSAIGVSKNLRLDLYKHINTFSFTELDKFSTATLNNRLTHDVARIQTAIGMFLRQVMRAPFLLIGSVVMALVLNAKLSIVFLIVTPIILGIVFLILKLTVPLYDKSQKSLDRVSDLTRENLQGVRVIRSFNKQQYEETKFATATKNLQKNANNVSKVSSLLTPLTSTVLNFAIVAVIWFGGFQINIGGLKQGELLAFINYLIQISGALVSIANIIIAFIKAINCGKRINEVFATKSNIQSPAIGVSETSAKTLITEVQNEALVNESATSLNESLQTDKTQKTFNKEIEKTSLDNQFVKAEYLDYKVVYQNVSIAYGDAPQKSVDNLSLKIRAGETIGIIGGTGSGKTSVVNLLPRFYDTTEGNIFIDGINVRDYEIATLRKKFGIVPQKAVLFSGTLKENMKWRKADATDEEIFKAIDIAQASEFVSELDNGLNYIVQAGGKNFSGGQRQRLTIARALVGEPEILILDDSASALDFTTDANLRKAIKLRTKNTTTFIVSQRVNSIKNADNIVVMDKGQVVSIGKHEELLETCSIYKEIYDSQTK